jgi:mannose-1-phosphate guanylyltransferase/mannose-6-phosphate isomerase
MTDRIACYVMSGGVGSRLWPLSREDNPKQFHDFSGEGSMLARTVRRMAARQSGKAPVHVIAAERHAGRVQADIAGVDLSGGVAIYEPVGRNTAAAVALASLHSLEAYGDGLVLVAPSDHEIGPDSEFWKTIAAGEAAANAGHIVVFGVKPTQPETGYGYIEMLAAVRAGEAADVKRFVEKPDRETAQSYVDAGTFYWNTGIFLFKASTMRAAFEAHQPEIWKRVADALHGAARDVAGIWLPIELYETIPADSIDYAIMERTRGIAMTPATFRWNDLGSWQSLLEVSSTDESGNVLIGDVVAIDCERSYLRSQGRLLSVIGMKDAAVVSTSDATFVAPVGQSQNVRKVVEQLERSGRLETRFTPSADRTPYRGAVRRGASALVNHRCRPRTRRFPRGVVAGRPSAAQTETHADNGSSGLCLLCRQGAGLGRPGRSADRAWRRFHETRPYIGWRLGPFIRCCWECPRSDRGLLRYRIRPAGARPRPPLRPSRSPQARRGNLRLPRRPP